MEVSEDWRVITRPGECGCACAYCVRRGDSRRPVLGDTARMLVHAGAALRLVALVLLLTLALTSLLKMALALAAINPGADDDRGVSASPLPLFIRHAASRAAITGLIALLL